MSLHDVLTIPTADTLGTRIEHPSWCTSCDVATPGERHPRFDDPTVVGLINHDSGEALSVSLCREDLIEAEAGGTLVMRVGEPRVFITDDHGGRLTVEHARALAADILATCALLDGSADH